MAKTRFRMCPCGAVAIGVLFATYLNRPSNAQAAAACSGLSSSSSADQYATSAELERRDQRVTSDDVRVLERADKMLATPASWNRHDDRICTPRVSKWSLFCALQDAAREIFGEERYRAVAIQEVRFTVEDRMKRDDVAILHRLTDYNNLPSTSFSDIKDVLKVTTERVAARLASQRQ